MTYDQNLADRISGILKNCSGITTKKMFGGLCFLFHGNMVCGIADNKFVARVGPDRYETAVEKKYASPMTFTGKPLKGMVYVTPEGVRTASELTEWIELSMDYVKMLPPK